MKPRSPTQPVPAAADFPATRWSLVVAAQGEDDRAKAREALTELAAIYREPVRGFLLAEGHSEERAEVLAREFFEGLEAGQFESATQDGRRFRTWLLSALRDFVSQRSAAASSVRIAREPAPSVCPHCGASVASDETSMPCPACLLSGGIGALPKAIGGYRILEELGRGGMSIVYRARQSDVEPEVALKVLKPELTDVPAAVDRFRKAIEIAGKLEHRNIARVYAGAGVYEQPPFFTMQLAKGGALADALHQRKFRNPRFAAKLMIKIARAVHFAHERAVLHRDLKPGNILLDEDGEPLVADFLARRIHDGGPVTVGGTPNYMSPEQARGEGGTIAEDVYGLGSIFYELLTKRPPIEAKSIEEALKLHASAEIARPSSLSPGLDPNLEAICLAALEKEPALRHASAASFADSLERVLEHRPPLHPPIPWRRRIALWTRRHPLLAIGALVGTLLLLLVDVAMFAGARSSQAELQSAVLRSNAALASAQARAVLTILKKYADHTLRSASEPAVQDLLRRRALGEAAVGLREVYERSNFDPDAVFIIDPEGVLLARWPLLPSPSVGKSYRFRDYFTCAEALARSKSRDVCISPAYRSEVHNRIQFAFSAPVYDTDNRWLGMLVMSKVAAQTLAEVEIGDSHGSGQITAVFAARGVDRDTAASATPPAEKFIALIHSRLGSTQEFALGGELTERLLRQFGRRAAWDQFAPNPVRPLEDDDYRDPLSDPQDRWLAGFAPVGKTGYLAVVATPHERALGPSQRLIVTLSTYGGLLNLSFFLIAAFAVAASLRESRAHSDTDH